MRKVHAMCYYTWFLIFYTKTNLFLNSFEVPLYVQASGILEGGVRALPFLIAAHRRGGRLVYSALSQGANIKFPMPKKSNGAYYFKNKEEEKQSNSFYISCCCR